MDIVPAPNETATLNAPARHPSELQFAFLSLRNQLEKFIARRVRCPQVAEDLASEI